VAEHSYFVALYAYDIARLLYEGGEAIDLGRLQRMALIHDAEEAITGDTPGPIKRSLYRDDADDVTRRMVMQRFPHDPYNPDDIERAIIRTASLLEETLYLAGEVQMGNRAAEAVFRRSSERLYRIWRTLPASPRNLDTWWQDRIDPAIDRELHQPSAINENNGDLE
jgi:5'-deoxynucleotidase YfbR-like HD superfamily hydrolase